MRKLSELLPDKDIVIYVIGETVQLRERMVRHIRGVYPIQGTRVREVRDFRDIRGIRNALYVDAGTGGFTHDRATALYKEAKQVIAYNEWEEVKECHLNK